ncbi:MAG: response regulator, partial [Chloroflexota bacterium]
MTIKILFVDDEVKLHSMIRQLFKNEIKEGRYHFSFAEDGEGALEQLQVDPAIEVVLADIDMPRMNGLKLLGTIQASKSTLNPVLTVIIISAHDDMANIRKAMNGGAFDFLTKPLELDDVRNTLAKAINHVNRLKQALAKEKLAQETLQEMNDLLDQRVKQRTAELSQSNAELDAFARTVAHNLKNSFGIIVNYSDYLFECVDELDSAQLLETVAVIRDAGHNGSKIIDKLLLLATVRKQDITIEPLDMEELVLRARQRLFMQFRESQGEITHPDVWPLAEGYAPWVEEVWFNYMSNALNYGGTPPQVTLGATPQANGMIRFWIRDNGNGIAVQAQEKIFGEFSRLHRNQAQGHGLGLSIVRR